MTNMSATTTSSLPHLATTMGHVSTSALFCTAEPEAIGEAFAPIPAIFSDFTGKPRFANMLDAPADELIQARPEVRQGLRHHLSRGVLRRRDEFTAQLVCDHGHVIGMAPRLGPKGMDLLEPKAVTTILSETWKVCGIRVAAGTAGIVVSNAIGWQTCIALNGYLTLQYGPEVAWPASLALYALSWGIFGFALWTGGKPTKSMGKAVITKLGISMRGSMDGVDVAAAEKAFTHITPQPDNPSILCI